MTYSMAKYEDDLVNRSIILKYFLRFLSKYFEVQSQLKSHVPSLIIPDNCPKKGNSCIYWVTITYISTESRFSHLFYSSSYRLYIYIYIYIL